MKTGTCHFPSMAHAMTYYRPYAESEDVSGVSKATAKRVALSRLVARKLSVGEITIGKPALKPGETLTIEDNRYHITTP